MQLMIRYKCFLNNLWSFLNKKKIHKYLDFSLPFKILKNYNLTPFFFGFLSYSVLN